MATALILVTAAGITSFLCYGIWTLGTFHGYEKGMDEAIEIYETLAANRERREARGND